ncbi:MAG: AAA-like domain-containing protein [Cyanobacteria bacterium P01_C01_bin.118]
MARWFNTAGPCKPDIHYMLSPVERLPQLRRIIDQQGYFVIHAPRQTGKTTAMLALAQELTTGGDYTAIMVSVEVGSALINDLDAAELSILDAWRGAARFRLPSDLQPPLWPSNIPTGRRIGAALSEWAQQSSRPLVVFIDEIDSLQNELLISVLRQLRDGYPNRPQGFPYALALAGLRDVRDYKVAAGGSSRLNTSSPFNIKVKSLTLNNFTITEVAQLYSQHTTDTGQGFTEDAISQAFELTQGQPWLVNALAKEAVEELAPDPTQPIDAAIINRAKENLIQRQDTHLDSLIERLQEERVRAVIEPMLAGQELGVVSADDRQFLIDLGLLVHHPAGGLTIANPIYREVLPRALASGPQASLPIAQPSWLTDNGHLDADKLLAAFLSFWRQHGEPLLKSAPYHEIAPHLVMMAFLHRVVNGGGTLEREYAIGSGRMDLCLRYGDVTIAIELKVWRDNCSDPLKKGLEQLDAYLSGLGLNQGWLVIFDRRSGLPPIAERTTTDSTASPQGREITVIRG